MAAKPTAEPQSVSSGPATAASPVKGAPVRREIPGNLPYLNAHGTLKRILDKTIELAKPDKFNYDFLENVVKITGGAARACIPIMKKMGFLNSDNSTTELYSRFRTEGGRSAAAYAALKNSFPEIFKRSDYAYKVDEGKLRDIIVEITGLKASDQVAQAIKGTFNVIKGYIDPVYNPDNAADTQSFGADSVSVAQAEPTVPPQSARQLGISYNINIVLPETSNLEVLNAIFKSVRENLLQ